MDPRFEIQTCAHVLADWRAGSSERALTHGERMRLATIVSVSRREQFLAGRWLAKKMLAEARGGSPEDWHIDADTQKKPVVVGHSLQLTISHSGSYVACCVTEHAAGIDVECFERVRPLADMAALVCSGSEQSTLHALQGDALTQHFFQLWTCKEARLKQLGASFDVNALRAIHMAPVEAANAQVGTWSFLGQQNVVLSLAVKGLSRLHARWPAHWVASPTQWHRYIEFA